MAQERVERHAIPGDRLRQQMLYHRDLAVRIVHRRPAGPGINATSLQHYYIRCPVSMPKSMFLDGKKRRCRSMSNKTCLGPPNRRRINAHSSGPNRWVASSPSSTDPHTAVDPTSIRPKQATATTKSPPKCRTSIRPTQISTNFMPATATRGRILLIAWCHFDVSSTTGQRRLLSYIPDLSKQHGRRFPLTSMSQAVLIRRARVSACLAETIQ
jgi:hypothetical protein